MSAYRLHQRRVVKPWGRTRLWPAFDDPAPGDEPIGEIWFEEEGDPELLVKYLFTRERLSVQVHPDDDGARARGFPRGKAECWLILAAEPDSTIALGPKATTTRDALRAAALDGSIVDLLDWRPVQAGDFIYSPAGTVHAIGAGITLIEVQQNVDLTYRLYDYGRPRELHLDDGISVSDEFRFEGKTGRFGASVMLQAPSFSVAGLVGGHHSVRPGWFVPFEGEGRIGGSKFTAGECWRVSEPCEVELSPNARALHAARP